MKVRDILEVIDKDTFVSVFQVPIKKLGGTDDPEDLIVRHRGESLGLLQSNQNYLDYTVVKVCQISGRISIICKANEEQEREVIAEWYAGR